MKKLLPALLLFAASAGCNKSETSNPSPAPSAGASAAVPTQGKVLARVNGVPITDVDVDIKLQNDNHEAASGEAHRKNVLEQLIGKELLAQKAKELGLDQDPKYQEGIKRLMAQVSAHQRQELAELYLRREGDKRANFSDDEKRAYFKEHEKRIRTEVHVLQILRRSEGAIIEVRNSIDQGKPFEQAAKELFPNLPETQKPWDLGFLSFQKVPEPWREAVYEMKPGEKSGILRGPNERFWLIKLVEVRTNEALDYESVKDAIAADMKATKAIHTNVDLEKELRAKANVEMVGP